MRLKKEFNPKKRAHRRHLAIDVGRYVCFWPSADMSVTDPQRTFMPVAVGRFRPFGAYGDSIPYQFFQVGPSIFLFVKFVSSATLHSISQYRCISLTRS